MLSRQRQNSAENTCGSVQKRKPATFNSYFGFNTLVQEKESEYSDVDFEDEDEKEESDWSIDDDDMQEIDLCNFSQPLAVPRYAERIFQNDQTEERKFLISKDAFTSVQTEVTEKMRSILIKWIISVHHQKLLTSETLFNCVKYVDIVLSKQSIPKNELQLLGATALWMAAKLDERKSVKTTELAELCSENYEKSRFCQYETLIINALDYNLQFPTVKSFLRRYLTAIAADERLISIASFLCEATLLSYDLQYERQSVVALAVISLAILANGEAINVKTLLKYAHFATMEEAINVCPKIIEIATNIIKRKTGPIYERYSETIANFGALEINEDCIYHIPSK